MVRAFSQGNIKEALKIHAKYFPLFRNLFLETNPIPVKAAMTMLGYSEEKYRLPLIPMQKKNRELLEDTLRRCGVLKS
jgi:4-hydroxy-tetrahydrodipicolinate synthase